MRIPEIRRQLNRLFRLRFALVDSPGIEKRPGITNVACGGQWFNLQGSLYLGERLIKPAEVDKSQTVQPMRVS